MAYADLEGAPFAYSPLSHLDAISNNLYPLVALSSMSHTNGIFASLGFKLRQGFGFLGLYM